MRTKNLFDLGIDRFFKKRITFGRGMQAVGPGERGIIFHFMGHRKNVDYGQAPPAGLFFYNCVKFR